MDGYRWEIGVDGWVDLGDRWMDGYMDDRCLGEKKERLVSDLSPVGRFQGAPSMLDSSRTSVHVLSRVAGASRRTHTSMEHPPLHICGPRSWKPPRRSSLLSTQWQERAL